MPNTLLSINNYYYPRGGAEVVFLEHNKLFETMDWSVVPFAMQHPDNLASQWSDYFIEELEFGADYSLFEKMRRAPKVVYSLEAKKKLARLLDKVQPSVCHAHNIYHHISPSIYSLLHERNIPTIQTAHDLKVACPAYKMLTHDGVCERCRGGNLINVVKHRCIKDSLVLSSLIYVEARVHQQLGTYSEHVDCIVTPSEFFRDKLIEWGYAAERLRYIPNFVQTPAYSEREIDPGLFVFFGRLAVEKGVHTLIRASAKAGVRLRVVGTGPEEANLQQLASDIQADVEFTGRLDGAELDAAISGATAVVLPSEWYENAPMTILESYAKGIPIIGAAIGGIPELIIEGETGFLFESGATDELTDVLRSTAALSKTEIQMLGQHAYEFVGNNFTPAHYQERMSQLYGELTA